MALLIPDGRKRAARRSRPTSRAASLARFIIASRRLATWCLRSEPMLGTQLGRNSFVPAAPLRPVFLFRSQTDSWRHARHDLLEQFKPFTAEAMFEQDESGGI